MNRILFLALFFSLSVLADTNLAVVCTGTPNATQCQPNQYARPVASSLVHKADRTWGRLDSLAQTATIEICSNDVPSGSVANPATGAPCLSWSYLAVSAVTTGAINVTGKISLSWTAPDFTLPDSAPASALTGYTLYSGVLGSPLTLLATLPPGTLAKEFPGYANGKYQFAVTAKYGEVESIRTGPVDVEVAIPVQQVYQKPAGLTGTVSY